MASSTPDTGLLTAGPVRLAADLVARKTDLPVSPMLGRPDR